MPEPPTADEIRAVTAAIENGQAVVCYAKCWPCQAGDHFDPPQWHTWADEDDVRHAASTGQRDPRESRCGCDCAVVEEGGPHG